MTMIWTKTKSGNSAPPHELTPAKDFFTLVGLYQPFEMDTDEDALSVTNFDGTLEFYCSKCGEDVIFLSGAAEAKRGVKAVPGASPAPTPASWSSREVRAPDDQPDRMGLFGAISTIKVKEGIHTTMFYCSRNREHLIYFLFLIEDVNSKYCLTKVGQFPSVADLAQGELKKYRNMLGEERYKEFRTSIGLFSHGIGVGSFVYLRRIFEGLVEDAHQQAILDVNWDEEVYKKSHWDEKIKLLKSRLPDFLSENPNIYSILSKGIHALSEKECLRYFDGVKIGIEMILDEKLAEAEKRKKAEEARQAISSAHSELK